MNKLNLQIRDFGLIGEADIEINKINVVGGANASGKSTASKLLYCFLKANSANRKEYLSSKIILNINRFIKSADESFDKEFTKDNDLKEVIKAYENYKSDNTSIDGLIECMDSDDADISSALLRYLAAHESLPDLFDKSPEDAYAELSFGDFKSSIKAEDESLSYITQGTFDKFNDAFYISPVSVFDIMKFSDEKSLTYNEMIYGYEEHIADLLFYLSNSSDEEVDAKTKGKIENFTEHISQIIEGGFLDFGTSLSESKSVLAASGIKQIGILELLLSDFKLQPGSFLIMDEPEVSLHPEWQIRFAEILVLLVNDLDIQIYLNSHSPMFIEAISLYSQYYGLIDETNFYLTIKEKNNRFDFKKIDSKDMGEVYENLTKPYDELDKLKAKIIFRK